MIACSCCLILRMQIHVKCLTIEPLRRYWRHFNFIPILCRVLLGIQHCLFIWIIGKIIFRYCWAPFVPHILNANLFQETHTSLNKCHLFNCNDCRTALSNCFRIRFNGKGSSCETHPHTTNNELSINMIKINLGDEKLKSLLLFRISLRKV